MKLVLNLVKLLSEVFNVHSRPSNLTLTLKIELEKFFEIVQKLECFIDVHVMIFEALEKIWPEIFC